MILTIKRPTPTTVLYTVSTRSANNTLSQQIQRITIALLKLLLGLFTLLILIHKTSLSPSTNIDRFLRLPDFFLKNHAPGDLAHHLASAVPWKYLIPPSAAVFFLIFRRGYTEECLLVIRGLGVQTSTSSATYLSTASTRFIPSAEMQDIFIHEAFRGFECKFYLAIVVEGEEDVVVVFPVRLLKVNETFVLFYG